MSTRNLHYCENTYFRSCLGCRRHGDEAETAPTHEKDPQDLKHRIKLESLLFKQCHCLRVEKGSVSTEGRSGIAAHTVATACLSCTGAPQLSFFFRSLCLLLQEPSINGVSRIPGACAAFEISA